MSEMYSRCIEVYEYSEGTLFFLSDLALAPSLSHALSPRSSRRAAEHLPGTLPGRCAHPAAVPRQPLRRRHRPRAAHLRRRPRLHRPASGRACLLLPHLLILDLMYVFPSSSQRLCCSPRHCLTRRRLTARNWSRPRPTACLMYTRQIQFIQVVNSFS